MVGFSAEGVALDAGGLAVEGGDALSSGLEEVSEAPPGAASSAEADGVGASSAFVGLDATVPAVDAGGVVAAGVGSEVSCLMSKKAPAVPATMTPTAANTSPNAARRAFRFCCLLCIREDGDPVLVSDSAVVGQVRVARGQAERTAVLAGTLELPLSGAQCGIGARSVADAAPLIGVLASRDPGIGMTGR